ncbi:MAG: EF-hand domain-containing protein [Congregibacter sp.]
MNVRSSVTVTAGLLATLMVSFGMTAAYAHRGGDILSLDSDGDGQVSIDEFRLAERGGKRAFFRRADADGDGVVSRDDVLLATDNVSDERREQVRERALQRFDQMDSDGNGVVTSDEVKQQMFAVMDSNGDGFLTEEEAQAQREKRGEMRGQRGKRERKQEQEQEDSGS